MKAPKFVFLDLEGTVISIIDDPVLMNIDDVSRFLRKEEVEHVGIFSFAIDNDEERTAFSNSWTHKALQQTLKVMIGRIITVEEVMKTVRQKNKVSFEGLWELKQLWGKERGFIDFCKMTFKNCEVVLLDDLVDNVTVHVHDRNLTIRIVNVNTL